MGSYTLYVRLFGHFMDLEVYRGPGPTTAQELVLPSDSKLRPAAALAMKVWGPQAPQAEAAIMLEFRERGVTLYADEYDKVEEANKRSGR